MRPYPCKDRERGKRGSERLKKGEKLANIAKEVSLCPSEKRSGDFGTFSRGKMVKEFAMIKRVGRYLEHTQL